MEKHRGLARTIGLLAFFFAVLAAFFFILFDLQVLHKVVPRAKPVTTYVRTETFPAARGELSDRYGRSLVTNQIVYQVTLDLSLMGEDRNDTILTLIRVAEAQGVSWTDSLPISRSTPAIFNISTKSSSAQSNYRRLAKALGWKSDTGEALTEELRMYYKLDPALSPEEARSVLGILYELSLRQNEILWSDYVFATDVDTDFIAQVREHSLSGVLVAPASTRKYNTSYAAHLLGRVGLMDAEEWQVYKDQGYAMNETVGKGGVEEAFQSYLRGAGGTRRVERNASGKIIDQTWLEEPSPGLNVSLTIDLPLQQKLEEVLAAGIPTLPSPDTQGGGAVILDVNTSAVLAAASYPTYDLANIFKDADLYQAALDDPLHPFTNRATQGRYSPGSTFKMVTGIAGLEEGLITPTTQIMDTGRYTYYTSPQPACWVYRNYGTTHGMINVSQALDVSCNVFFFDVGRRLGIRKLGEYANAFGLGLPTGIEIPEFQGVVAGPDYSESLGQPWYEGSVLSAAIGQENNQFSPLQLANYTAALANGGTVHAAHLLKCVRSADYTEVVETYEPKVLNQVDMAPENLEAIKKGMVALAQGSLAWYFRDLDFTVACKTGSAETNEYSQSTAVFVCFAPVEDPQIALAMVVEKGGTGAELAGFAADVLSFYFSAQREQGSVTAENTLLR